MVELLEHSRLQPLFLRCMHCLVGPEIQNFSHLCMTVPLEVRVVKTIPAFEVSDGFHKVRCAFSKVAVASYLKESPSMHITELLGRLLRLLEYAPHFCYLPDRGFFFVLHIYSFELLPIQSVRAEALKEKEWLSQAEVFKDFSALAHWEHEKQVLLGLDSFNILEMEQPFESEPLEYTTQLEFPKPTATSAEPTELPDLQGRNMASQADIEALANAQPKHKVVVKKQEVEATSSPQRKSLLDVLQNDGPVQSLDMRRSKDPTDTKTAIKLLFELSQLQNVKTHPVAGKPASVVNAEVTVKQTPANEGMIEDCDITVTEGTLRNFIHWRSYNLARRKSIQAMATALHDNVVTAIPLQIVRLGLPAIQLHGSSQQKKRTAAQLEALIAGITDSKRPKP